MSLIESKNFAESLRFSGDLKGNIDDTQSIANKDELFLESGVRITEALLPEIYASIVKVCNRLKLPLENIEVFLVNDFSPNALCYRFHPKQCRIAISSGLVQLLNPEELEFVIGHEVGHFLLDHVFENDYRPHPANEAFLSNSRAREISADRIGMIASESIDTAIKAMIKTQTGLPSKYLRFDVAEFIRNLPSGKNRDHSSSTHPNFYMRVRFLLWASMAGNVTDEHRKKICDQKILRDLDDFFDAKKRAERQEILNEMRFWILVLAASFDGVLSRQDQDKIKELGYEDHLNRLKNLLYGLSAQDVPEKIKQRVLNYKAQLTLFDLDGGNNIFEAEIKNASEIYSVDAKAVLNFCNSNITLSQFHEGQ